jgi:hypothetical protein
VTEMNAGLEKLLHGDLCHLCVLLLDWLSASASFIPCRHRGDFTVAGHLPVRSGSVRIG